MTDRVTVSVDVDAVRTGRTAPVHDLICDAPP